MLRAALHAALALQILAPCACAVERIVHELHSDAQAINGSFLRQLQSAEGLPATGAKGTPSAAEPLNIGFYIEDDPDRSADDVDYIKAKLLPAAIHTLQRSIRLRKPAGPMNFGDNVDIEAKPIKQPPPGVNFWVKVTDTSQCKEWNNTNVLAAGYHSLVNLQDDGRPTFAYLVICKLIDFNRDLETITHELVHTLGMHPDLIPDFSEGSKMVTDGRGRRYIAGTQVTASARAQLGCSILPGAALEDDLGGSGLHFDQRVFEGELMDSQSALSKGHSSMHSLTDLTLGLLQDTGWYDVKYGSAGFNPYGYKSGCNFALYDYESAIERGRAKRYLCEKSEEGAKLCLHDATGAGTCQSKTTWDGFYAVHSKRGDLDCMDTPAQRCVQPRGGQPACAQVSCSNSGNVLINDKECNKDKYRCPNRALMCRNPGLLTCQGELSDCSGHGDCAKGHCYCHLGWGGASCNVPICADKCLNGTACPASGYCGVEECGGWSVGADDRGKACGPL